VLNPELVKGPWTPEEDAKVVDLVNTHGAKKWSLIANCLPGRIGKQCRERLQAHRGFCWQISAHFLLLTFFQVAQPSQPAHPQGVVVRG